MAATFVANTGSNTVQQQMRTACNNILYTVANSNAYDLVSAAAPWWIWPVCGVDIVALGLLTFGLFVVTCKKKDADAVKKQ